MRCACIDIGSTTTRLLVAERGAAGDGPVPVGSARAYTPDAAADLARVVDDQLELARTLGASAVRVVGTAFLRGRPEVAAALPVPVEVLDGEEEGRLAFLGATYGRTGTCAVVDVGGGSTEVVVGLAGGAPDYVRSFPAGSGVLVAQCAPLDPPSHACLARLAEAAAAALAACDAPPAACALAVGGSATALAAADGAEPSAPLTPQRIERALEGLCGEPAAAVARRTGLHPRRVRLLPGGLSLLAASSRALDRPLELARRGLREGVVLEQLRLV